MSAPGMGSSAASSPAVQNTKLSGHEEDTHSSEAGVYGMYKYYKHSKPSWKRHTIGDEDIFCQVVGQIT